MLGENIRNNPNIHGIRVNGAEIKSGQFIDDMLIFSTFETDSLQASINTLGKFERNSCLKLNYDKSPVHRIGSLKNSNARLYTSKELNWTSEKIYVPGIEIVNWNELIQGNYGNMMQKIKDILFAWRYRGLSLIGKIIV